MGARRKRSRRSRRNGTAVSTVLWATALAALVTLCLGGGWIGWRYASSRTVIDDANLCPVSGPTGTLAMLLDLTDPLTPQQGARLATMIKQRVENLPEGTLVSFGVVSSDETRLGSLFAACHPGDGRMASQIYQNPAMIRARFDREFMTPLLEVLGDTIRTAEEDISPIMESLQALIAATPAFETGGGMRELVIVSDLLQNSETISFYRGEGWDDLRRSDGTGRLARNLSGVEVSVVRVPRPGAGARALERVDDFWARYFDQQGARAPISVTPLGDL
jgi:hypothetical protein